MTQLHGRILLMILLPGLHSLSDEKFRLLNAPDSPYISPSCTLDSCTVHPADRDKSSTGVVSTSILQYLKTIRLPQ
jgi:hypothetical protein